MKKPIIDAKQASIDIRSGMDDEALMRKYRLTPKGLKSLLSKLGAARIIKYLNASDVLQDFRSGSSERDLMEKYGLSHRGLDNLLSEMRRAGIHREAGRLEAMPAALTVCEEEIVEAIRAGRSRKELLEEFRLTDRGLRWTCVTLISKGLVSWREVNQNLCSTLEELAPENYREARRWPLKFEVLVYDAESPHVEGIVRDISDKGLAIKGIKVEAGENRAFIIAEDDFGEYAKIAVEAQCKWARRDSDGEYVAGFEITHASAGHLRELQLLKRLAKLANGNGEHR
ncbi:PilZ domain-containing protein [Thermodesulfobacteriota bacterium]